MLDMVHCLGCAYIWYRPYTTFRELVFSSLLVIVITLILITLFVLMLAATVENESRAFWILGWYANHLKTGVELRNVVQFKWVLEDGQCPTYVVTTVLFFFLLFSVRSVSRN
jgi:hypothetical protein